ncbi:hypothetical protein L2E82_38757 [Cichorium intybus]|uniref:Uncharacterized protein n=1 Tax=Cichorium intybus TaxID=13427 RepID=A0ACB9AHR6_CICIN|nr:hypothetical protein L2E82_38757 [Cichorium intybus]
MIKYYHLLPLRRSKGLLISNRRWVHQTSQTELHHLLCHLQTPPPPSSYFHIYRNTYRRNAIVSHHRLHATHSNLTGNHYHFQLSTFHTSDQTYHKDATPLDYQLTVKGRDFISAAVALGNKQYWLPLTNLDLLLPPLEVGLFFCYKKKDTKDMSSETVVNTIKSSLAGIAVTDIEKCTCTTPSKLQEAICPVIYLFQQIPLSLDLLPNSTTG